MAIAAVRTHVVSEALEQPFFFSQFRYDRRTICLVQVVDDGGQVGWGEGYGPAGPVKAGVEFLAPFILGEDPLECERLWRVMHRRAFDHARQGVLVAALSALDVALWDLKGKLLGQPLSVLLGGRRREEVTAYATGMYFTDGPGLADRLAEEARRHRDAGFGAMKMKVGLSVDEDTVHVEAVRKAVGPDVTLMVDANHAYGRREALSLARAIESFDIRWFEEPLSPDDLDGFRWLRGQTSIPLATGECECLRAGFRRLLESGGVDVVQPDLCHAGGITETRRIVDMAETFGVEYAPHCWGSAVGLAAAVHLLATRDPIPGRLRDPEPLLELDRTRNVFREELAHPRLMAEGGRVRVPEGPGLGIEIDEALVERYSVDV